jgi:hypothetical protein
MSDDLAFRLMFSLWAAGAAVTAYVIGRFIVGPGNWSGH